MKIILSSVILLILSGLGLYTWQNHQQQIQLDNKLIEGNLAAENLKSEQERFTGTMLIIPAGTFDMGSLKGDKNESKIHLVNIKSFKLGESEVTWSLYQPCIDEGVCADNISVGGDMGWGKGERPVINVSYEDITLRFLPWLYIKTGQIYRLPTESEWEYASRAGSRTKYSWGDDIKCSQARYGRRKRGECSPVEEGTVKVKSFSPNAFGLYDMHGNVWEWIEDCYVHSYQQAPRDGTAVFVEDCPDRVYRSSSWVSIPFSLRSAYRGRNKATHRSYSSGFRLAQ